MPDWAEQILDCTATSRSLESSKRVVSVKLDVASRVRSAGEKRSAAEGCMNDHGRLYLARKCLGIAFLCSIIAIRNRATYDPLNVPKQKL